MAGVTSSYPAALDSESNLTPPNNGDTLSVADHWLAGNSGPIVAIETELGTDPAGYATDVKTRLNTINPSSGLLAADGLQFPGTQVASADANTLDDYEEGTWTPVWTTNSGTPVFTYNSRYGYYRKIGDLVHTYHYMDINVTTPAGSTAALRSSSLPFTPQSLSLTAYGHGGFTIKVPGSYGNNANAFQFNVADPSTVGAVIYYQSVDAGGAYSIVSGVYAGYLSYLA